MALVKLRAKRAPKTPNKVLFLDTGMAFASMILVPALGQRLGVSPVLTKAVKSAWAQIK